MYGTGTVNQRNCQNLVESIPKLFGHALRYAFMYMATIC